AGPRDGRAQPLCPGAEPPPRPATEARAELAAAEPAQQPAQTHSGETPAKLAQRRPPGQQRLWLLPESSQAPEPPAAAAAGDPEAWHGAESQIVPGALLAPEARPPGGPPCRARWRRSRRGAGLGLPVPGDVHVQAAQDGGRGGEGRGALGRRGHGEVRRRHPLPAPRAAASSQDPAAAHEVRAEALTAPGRAPAVRPSWPAGRGARGGGREARRPQAEVHDEDAQEERRRHLPRVDRSRRALRQHRHHSAKGRALRLLPHACGQVGSVRARWRGAARGRECHGGRRMDPQGAACAGPFCCWSCPRAQTSRSWCGDRQARKAPSAGGASGRRASLSNDARRRWREGSRPRRRARLLDGARRCRLEARGPAEGAPAARGRRPRRAQRRGRAAGAGRPRGPPGLWWHSARHREAARLGAGARPPPRALPRCARERGRASRHAPERAARPHGQGVPRGACRGLGPAASVIDRGPLSVQLVGRGKW
ncbi:unnamed protein product, partial [Prorocentrum cordatum]